MFKRHAARFKENPPASLFEYFFVSDPAVVPCETRELCVFEGSELIAISYIDLGHDSVSGIYGMFEPSCSRRSLGIYTILKDRIAIESGKELLSCYSYEGRRLRLQKQFWHRSLDWNVGGAVRKGTRSLFAGGPQAVGQQTHFPFRRLMGFRR